MLTFVFLTFKKLKTRIIQNSALYLDLNLDLFPPVLSTTLGDELSLSDTIVGSISRVTPVSPVNARYVQVFFQCVLPCPPWSSSPPPTIFWPHF